MSKSFLLLLLLTSGLLLFSTALSAQQAKQPEAPETTGHTIARLKHRFEIDDIDGIGELIEPLFAQVVNAQKTDLDLPQKHLIAMAAMKFSLASGDHTRAIVPFLIALHLQTATKENPRHKLLVKPVDQTETFRTKYLPTLFFTDEDRSRFRDEFDNALSNGVCLKTELSKAYYNASENQRSPAQQKMLDAIARVKKNPQPSDRDILKLIEHFATQRTDHPAIANKSLATAIQGLRKLKRTAEAEKLISCLPMRSRILEGMSQ
jgi:hypothetical protein